jgi:hypothetical protein
MTLTRDYFKGLQHIAKIFDLPLGSGLLYGGEASQKRTGVAIHPVTEVHDLLHSLETS